MLPVGGGVATQDIAKLASTMFPAVTVTVRDGPSCTEQFSATPESTTVCSPGARLSTVAASSVPIGWGEPPSTVKLYPSLSCSSPEVEVLTRTEPVSGGSAVQVMV